MAEILLYLRAISVELSLNKGVGLLWKVDYITGSEDVESTNFTLLD
jgi:hypothetical protein